MRRFSYAEKGMLDVAEQTKNASRPYIIELIAMSIMKGLADDLRPDPPPQPVPRGVLSAGVARAEPG